MAVTYFFGARDSSEEGTFSVSDNDSQSNTFTVGEELFVTGPTAPSGDFVGTTVVGGETYVILQLSAFVTYLLGPAQDFLNFPEEYSSLTVDTSDFTVCFLAGTTIATPTGAVPVEDLAVGDLVVTADGRIAPVRWVGIQSVVTLFADSLRTFPIRITAGALGEGLPVRDLLVSPDHALMLEGALVQAGALVNGTTIVRETGMPERFTYYHVELEDHSLILAEGVPAETFVDNVTRRRFDNHAEFEALYGETGPTIAEMAAPRVKSARQLPRALRERLSACASSLQSEAKTAA